MENNRNAVLLDNVENVLAASESQEHLKKAEAKNITSSFYSDALDEADVNKLVKNSRPELIVLLGLNDFGKSTFVGSLYHLLRSKGSLGNMEFYDSETFVGFEKRVYLRRLEYDGPSTTKRTIRGENSFLHLSLRKQGTDSFYDVVISDRSGEDYRDYISKDALILGDRAISQADKLLLFVDSTKLYGRDYRSMYDDLTSLIHRLKEKDKLPIHAIVYVVFNKLDLQPEEYKDKKAHENEIVQMVQEAFGEVMVNQISLDSKSLDGNKHLENFFITILQPNENQGDEVDLDWVNNEIE